MDKQTFNQMQKVTKEQCFIKDFGKHTKAKLKRMQADELFKELGIERVI
jgi:cell fate (sporulation/competence/biofilm development) regulator YmcA (YheA/YmcA/DUF963 family)